MVCVVSVVSFLSAFDQDNRSGPTGDSQLSPTPELTRSALLVHVTVALAVQ